MQRLLARLKKENSKYHSVLEKVDISNFSNILNYLDIRYELAIYQNLDDYQGTDYWGDNGDYKRYRIGFLVPDFDITNSRGYNTHITGFVVMPFIINNKHVINHDLRFMRESWDYKQARIGYVHSHVSSNFNYMCVGSTKTLAASFYEETDMDQIHYNVTTFIEHLKWESIEGGPYKRIDGNQERDYDIVEMKEINVNEIAYEGEHIKVTFDDVLFRTIKKIKIPKEDIQLCESHNEGIYYKNGVKKHRKILSAYEVQTFNLIKKIITEKYYGEAIANEIRANQLSNSSTDQHTS